MRSERGGPGPTHNKPCGHAFVTGADGGIGRALASRFAVCGHCVIAIDRTVAPAGVDSVEYHQVDLQAPAVDATYADSLIGEISRSTNQESLNLLAPFRLSQELQRDFARASGFVVSIRSPKGCLTKADCVGRAIGAAASSGLTRAMAVDVGRWIRVNAIEPTAIATEMLKAGFEGSPKRYVLLEACYPQGSIGTLEDGAALALALAMGELRFLHGASIGLDGGVRSRLFNRAFVRGESQKHLE